MDRSAVFMVPMSHRFCRQAELFVSAVLETDGLVSDTRAGSKAHRNTLAILPRLISSISSTYFRFRVVASLLRDQSAAAPGQCQSPGWPLWRWGR